MGDSSPLGLVDLSFSAIQATEQHREMPAIPDDLVSDMYSTANDPQPQMIPRPQMIPKMDRK